MSRLFAGSVLILGVLVQEPVFAAPVSAQQGQEQAYEQERLALILQELKLAPDPAPEGKTVEFIRIVSHEVFVPDEPWPTFLNLFHALTREEVVERELVFEAGDRYSEIAVQESMRNLRDLGIFSLVSIAAVKSSGADRVGVVVHTRDLWSLRLEYYVQFTGSGFDQFQVRLTELNLLGRDKRVSIIFNLLPLTFSLGEVYADPRFFGQELALAQSFDLIFNRSTGEPEGSVGSLAFGRPFYDLQQRWAFSLSAGYVDAVSRRVRNGRVAAVDLEQTAEVEAIPVVYDDRSISLIAGGSFRRGRHYKQTFSAGAGYRDRSVAPNRETGLLAGQREAFAREVLPAVRREVFPYASYQLFLPRYEVFRNLGTFGQSESVRVGPLAELAFEAPVRVLGSDSDSLLTYGRLSFVWARFDALVDLALEPSARLEDGRVVDQLLVASARCATPRLWLGRLVLRAEWQGRRRDTSREAVSLGGDNGLRGYDSQAFQLEGASLALANVELRTLPLVWRSVHVGAVLFYDAGGVYRDIERLVLHHAAGLGVRLLFPQINRYAFRFDLGIPLQGECCRFIFTFGNGQAVPLTAAELGSGAR